MPPSQRNRQDPLIGVRVGRGLLLIQEWLGDGAHGAVYRAYDEKNDRPVAIKFLQIDASADVIDRFKREARLFGTLRHPNVVRVFGFGRDKGRIYIISEFVDGRNLWDVLREAGPFPVDDALRTVRDVASGLHAAHKAHFVHRDLKPENIMLAEPGRVVKIVDFGIAKDLGASQAFTKHGRYLGTPGYSAPEQNKGLTVDCRTDIFSLGVILYEILAGKVAFNGKQTLDVLHATISVDPMPVTEINRSVTAPVARLISRMIQKSPQKRPKDMSEVIAEIDTIRAALGRGSGDDDRAGLGKWLRKLFLK